MSFQKYVLAFICSSIFLLRANTQNTNRDSILQKSLKERTSKYLKQQNFKKAQEYYLLKDWDSTLVYSMKQLSNVENPIEVIDYCYFFRAVAFNKKKIFGEAQDQFSKISESFYFDEIVQMYLGTIALEQEEYKKALDYFLQIEDYTEEELKGINKNNIEENIGVCYVLLNQFDEASRYLNKVVSARKVSNDTLGLITTYVNVANSYYEKYEDDTAIDYFKKAYNLSKNVKDFYSKSLTAANMSVVEENRKNYQSALVYRKEWQQWQDSLNDQNKIYEVAKIEKQFAVSQKQQELDILQLENEAKETQRNAFILSALVLLALLGVSIYYYREKVKTNKIISDQNEELDQLNATKDKLFSIVSHDLRSSVNALKSSNKGLINSLKTKNIEELDAQLNSNSAIVNGAYNLLDNLLNWALLQTKQTYSTLR